LIPLLEAVQTSGPAAFLRTSFYFYPILNAVHIMAIGALVTSALLMDLRVFGLWHAIPSDKVMALLRPVAIAALVLAVVSGLLLFSVRPLEYVANPAFRLKLVLLVLAIANAIAFIVLSRDVRDRRAILRILAALSLLLWPSTVLAGRFIGFLQ
jgi:hypothetical protein